MIGRIPDSKRGIVRQPSASEPLLGPVKKFGRFSGAPIGFAWQGGESVAAANRRKAATRHGVRALRGSSKLEPYMRLRADLAPATAHSLSPYFPARRAAAPYLAGHMRFHG